MFLNVFMLMGTRFDKTCSLYVLNNELDKSDMDQY